MPAFKPRMTNAYKSAVAAYAAHDDFIEGYLMTLDDNQLGELEDAARDMCDQLDSFAESATYEDYREANTWPAEMLAIDIAADVYAERTMREKMRRVDGMGIVELAITTTGDIIEVPAA